MAVSIRIIYSGTSHSLSTCDIGMYDADNIWCYYVSTWFSVVFIIYRFLQMDKKLNIALVAHDARKQELIDWCRHNAEWLSQHNLYGTGTTAKLISKIVTNHELEDSLISIKLSEPLNHINKLLSGPLGGDQQIGAMIAEGKVDVLIFFCDNLITQGHQQDVGALSRLASLYNIAFASNRTTADMIITSHLITDSNYERIIPKAIESYKNRFVK